MSHFLQHKRVLVTGGNGFIGSRLIEKLGTVNAETFAMLRQNSDRSYFSIFGEPQHYIINDLDDLPATTEVLQHIKPHYVFHTATCRQYQNAPALFHSNVTAAINVFEASLSEHLQAFIGFSSSTEYGEIAAPFQEYAHAQPNSIFGASKLAASQALILLARQQQVPCALLRLFHVYGPGEPAHRLIPTAIRAIYNDRTLPLTTKGYCHDYVFIDDVITACFMAAETAEVYTGLLNICTGTPTNNEDVVAIIEKILGKKAQLDIGGFTQRKWDKSDWYGDNQKARDLIGWTPQYSLEQGLTQTLNWLEDIELKHV